MKIIGVIPARWGSTRFEGKVLAEIAEKPMVQHVWERVKESKLVDDVLIACDDDRVLSAVQNFGAKAVMTSKDHPSGTDRIAEAVKDVNADIVINIQGDEPMICPDVVDALAKSLLDDKSCPMATLVKEIEREDEISNPNVVKVVFDKDEHAVYFSRSTIPYNRDNQDVKYYKHLGIYAYRKKFLLSFNDLPKSNLENIEKLEQLRVIEAGYKIKTVLTDLETVGVDTPDDLAKVESLMKWLR